MNSLFEAVGPFGRCQMIYLFFLGLVSTLSAMNFYVTIFNVSEQELTCVPVESMNSSDITNNYDTCDMWHNYTTSKALSQTPAFQCYFDTSVYGLTIVNEWGLVCDKQYLLPLTQTIYISGSLVSFVSGILGDRYGRKRVCLGLMIVTAIVLVVAQILVSDLGTYSLSVMTRYVVYCVLQFLGGTLMWCLWNSAYVLLIEFTTDRYHTITSIINIYMYVLGELLVLVLFYTSSNWQITNWFTAIFSVVLVFIIAFIIPESPRWLVECGEFEKAFDILKKMSRINKTDYFELDADAKRMIDMLKRRSSKIENELAIHNVFTGCDEDERKDIHDTTVPQYKQISNYEIFMEMVTPCRNFLKLVALTIVFNAVTLIYYGVSIGMTTVLKINPYLMFLLASIFEVFGVALCHINDIIGRKKALFIYLMITVCTSLLVALVPDRGIVWITYLKGGFALIGRMMMSGAFNTLITFTAELYGTRVRTTALLFYSCIGCVGSLIAPQINALRTLVWEPLPYIVYSATTFVSCVIIFFLPETYHIELKK